MDERAQKETKLLEALKRCWYLPDDEKSHWLKNISTLPEHTLDNVTAEVLRGNKIAGDCINAAIEKKPQNIWLQEIKSKIKAIMKTAFEIEEGAPRKKAEKELEQKLKEI